MIFPLSSASARSASWSSTSDTRKSSRSGSMRSQSDVFVKRSASEEKKNAALLLEACYEGDLKQVKALSRGGVNLTPQNQAPLACALASANGKLVQFLLEKGANPIGQLASPDDCLVGSVADILRDNQRPADAIPVVKALQKHSQFEKLAMPLLDYAMTAPVPSTDLRDMLLADTRVRRHLNDADNDGYTPLVRAIYQADVDAVKALQRAGADLNGMTVWGAPLDIAQSSEVWRAAPRKMASIHSFMRRHGAKGHPLSADEIDLRKLYNYKSLRAQPEWAGYFPYTTKALAPWKLHIYADDIGDAKRLADGILPYLKKQHVAHKFLRVRKNAAGRSEFRLLLEGPMQRGKVFTTYFHSPEELVRTAKALDRLIVRLPGLKAPTPVATIVGDKPVQGTGGLSGRLFYRYDKDLQGNYRRNDGIAVPEGVEDVIELAFQRETSLKASPRLRWPASRD